MEYKNTIKRTQGIAVVAQWWNTITGRLLFELHVQNKISLHRRQQLNSSSTHSDKNYGNSITMWVCFSTQKILSVFFKLSNYQTKSKNIDTYDV